MSEGKWLKRVAFDFFSKNTFFPLKHRSSKKSTFLLPNLLKKQIVPLIYHRNLFFEKVWQ